ncbi:MAG: DMT family transporter [Pseudomonadota bacterium]
MELLWIPIALAAALFQAVRTAAQKALNAHLSTWMVTYVRSLFGLPVMLVYLAVVITLEGRIWPETSIAFFAYCAGTGFVQIMATYLLIRLFTMSNFAVGTVLTKSDVMLAAVIGSVFFSEQIDAVGWLAISLTIVGVVLLSLRRAGALGGGIAAGPMAVGLTAAFLFCLSYLFLREASLVLENGSALWRAAWSVVTVTTMQSVGLGAWLLTRRSERAEFAALPRLWRPVWFVGVTSALGSIGWFAAMALENASYVKAVGQVEVVFTVLISLLYFREAITRLEYVGIATIVVAVLLFVL